MPALKFKLKCVLDSKLSAVIWKRGVLNNNICYILNWALCFCDRISHCTGQAKRLYIEIRNLSLWASSINSTKMIETKWYCFANPHQSGVCMQLIKLIWNKTARRLVDITEHQKSSATTATREPTITGASSIASRILQQTPGIYMLTHLSSLVTFITMGSFMAGISSAGILIVWYISFALRMNTATKYYFITVFMFLHYMGFVGSCVIRNFNT